MVLTGGEIISLIRRLELETIECRFSVPKDIFEESRPTKYRRLSEEEIKEVFDRYCKGEKLVDLAKEYGTYSSYLSQQNKEYLRKMRNKTLYERIKNNERNY